MSSLTQWTWVWVNSRSWSWTRIPGVLQSMGLQRVRHNWAAELNWTEPGGAVGKEPVCQYRRHEKWIWSLGWKGPLTLEHPKIMSLTVSIVSPSICHTKILYETTKIPCGTSKTQYSEKLIKKKKKMRLCPSCALSKPFHGQQALYWPAPNYFSNLIFCYSPFCSLWLRMLSHFSRVRLCATP